MVTGTENGQCDHYLSDTDNNKVQHRNNFVVLFKSETVEDLTRIIGMSLKKTNLQYHCTPQVSRFLSSK